MLPSPRSIGSAAARLTGFAVLSVVLVAGGSAAVAADSSSAVPYTDGRSAGAVTLYDASGQAVTSGSVDAVPFVARVTSTQAVPTTYAGDGRAASLFVMVPRQATDPSQWVGLPYTAAYQYTSASQPEVRLVPDDSSLTSFMDIRPPVWNGFLQLRVVLGASGQQPDLVSYATADIQVTGNTWHLIQSGPTSQDLQAASALGLSIKGVAPGKAVATPVQAGSAPASAPVGAARGSASSATASSGGAASVAPGAAPSGGGIGAAASQRSLADTPTSSHDRSVSGAGALAALVLVVVAALWWRQAHRNGSPLRERSRLLDYDVRSKA